MSAKAMHTPGPWRVDMAEVTARDTVGIDGPGWKSFAEVYVRVGGRSSPEGEANAKLIAAAPDLLEALQAIADHYAGDDGLDRAMKEGIDAEIISARAALAKATTP